MNERLLGAGGNSGAQEVCGDFATSLVAWPLAPGTLCSQQHLIYYIALNGGRFYITHTKFTDHVFAIPIQSSAGLAYIHPPFVRTKPPDLFSL